MNLAISSYYGAKCEFIMAAQTLFIAPASQKWFGTNYSDTLNLLYSEFHAFKSNVESPGAVKRSNSIWGCCLEVENVPRFLFRRFCGNLGSHDKVLLSVNCRSLSEILALSFVKIAILSKKWCSSIKVK